MATALRHIAMPVAGAVYSITTPWRPRRAYPNGIKSFLELPGVGRESKKKILWDNCVRLYGFEPKVPEA